MLEPTQQQTAPDAREQPEPGTGPRIVTPAPEEPQVEPTGSEPDPAEETGGTPKEAALRREAAGHRRALREAESQRDAALEQVAALQRDAADRLVGDALQHAPDFWAVTDVADLRDDQGALDTEKVQARIDALIEERPHWKKAGDPSGVFNGGVRGDAGNRAPSFGERLKDAAGR